MVSNQILLKFCSEFKCEKCDYITHKKSSYSDHLISRKHLKSMVSNQILLKFCSGFVCHNCGKTYKDNSGLWRHKKKCNSTLNPSNNCEEINDEPSINDAHDKNELIMQLITQNTEIIKENIEFKNIMMEVLKNGTHNTTNINSHNKSFNLQFFLNETCKDAMNIMDFVDSIKLQLSDLEKVGEIGYIDGISNIIVKNLKALDIHQRPVHCIDKKRETLYIKDDDKWAKEEENKKMHNVIKKVADKNIRLISRFTELYPDCSKSTSKHSDKYNKIIVESMGGHGDNDTEKEEKMIKKISKEIIVDKELGI